MDRRNLMTKIAHYSLRPARYITLLEFAESLRELAQHAQPMFRPQERGRTVKPAPAVDNTSQVLLDSKAHKSVIEALRFQLDAWRTREPEDMDEDDFADLQNDIGYLEILLHTLQDEYAKRY